MINLLTSASPEMAILSFFLVVIGVKEAIELFKYFFGLVKKKVDKDNDAEYTTKDLINKLDKLEKSISERDKQIALVSDTIDLLVESDKDDIKGWIVERYHHFMAQEWIDDFSMDVIEKRFTHYQILGGNSYVETLVKQIRQLPRTPKSTGTQQN